jgi:hypothetical protein
MVTAIDTLWAEAGRALQARRPADAICYLAELVSSDPGDRHARVALAMALGDAGRIHGPVRCNI